MTFIRRPLSPGSGWQDISLYRAYADLSRENINEGRYFEGVVIACIGFDVLLNTMPDRLLVFNSSRLNASQRATLEMVQKTPLTAGKILSCFRNARVLDRRLQRSLEKLNRERNEVAHPFTGRSLAKRRLKKSAVTPDRIDKSVARRFYRPFCHVIDLAGGRSPRSEERELNQYIAERRRTFRKHFSKS